MDEEWPDRPEKGSTFTSDLLPSYGRRDRHATILRAAWGRAPSDDAGLTARSSQRLRPSVRAALTAQVLLLCAANLAAATALSAAALRMSAGLPALAASLSEPPGGVAAKVAAEPATAALALLAWCAALLHCCLLAGVARGSRLSLRVTRLAALAWLAALAPVAAAARAAGADWSQVGAALTVASVALAASLRGPILLWCRRTLAR